MQFGYSHKIQLFFFSFNIKFLSKTSIFFFGLNYKQINFCSYELKNIRPINIFTSKGIRFSKQIIYKKTGKISSYR
jgi:ribosomal protein L6P/L9E